MSPGKCNGRSIILYDGADTGFMPDLIAFAIRRCGAGPRGRYRPVVLGQDGRRLLDGQAVRCRAARLGTRNYQGSAGLVTQQYWVSEVLAMVRKKHGIIIETPTEARQAERGPSVLFLLVTSLAIVVLAMAVVWYVYFRT